uniref:ABC-type uncharacterized transport system involved in gliding motility, auxiliary component n=1 Tax=Candidatus Kentrum sp. SD TaxID=2126332 RepID=A0A451BL50_9GAMM|nr:MAG: ABC-type uncharacterized transport system involved in gliding motility, auxiliary component [Candidatus Kentron sp. SD]VFK38545.1 MAG: ABC-type uncharacterized transport system involved in gliding motility, auxiliary component [Candidatus Kentron sp. SD]VFK79003.1 MAG: ABC-type uncharacterized transport system involved in gliding motility, auxiliary component [Candidatus Kentron sp. SD]
MNIKWFASGGLVLAVVLLFAVNIFSTAAFRSVRMDLTEGELYTLSEGTRNILSTLEEPVTLRLFLSWKEANRLPQISAYAARVRELLEEYHRVSNGLVRVHAIEPEPFSEEEDRAVAYGLTAVPLNEQGDSFYFGLVATGSTDTEASIPFFSPSREAFLEYDITNLIHQAAYPDKNVIALISSLDMDGQKEMGMRTSRRNRKPKPWIVLEQIRQYFDVRTLKNDIENIPADVGILMLVHPQSITRKTLYAIDQFVLRGGRALVFVDPHSEIDSQAPNMLGGIPSPDTSSELAPLFTAWGVEFSPSKVVGDRRLAEQIRFQIDSRTAITDYPIWVRLSASEMDADDIITAELDSIVLASPGRLRATDEKKTRLLPLLQTTVNAMEYDLARVKFLTDPQRLLDGYRGRGEKYTLAARVTGPAQSAFPEGSPEDEDEDSSPSARKKESDRAKTPPIEHLSASKEDINIVIVADTDMLRDQFWVHVQQFLGAHLVQPTAANGTFVVNALDNLVGSNDLISIRSQGHFQRPFTQVDTIREEAEIRFRQKEKELLDKLRDTESKLVELERGRKGNSALVLSMAQQREIERFRDEKLKIRKALRDVRHQLRKNIERLEDWLKFINIALVPLLIGIGAMIAVFYRSRRKPRSAAAT